MSAIPIIEAALRTTPEVAALLSGGIHYSAAPQDTKAPFAVLIGGGESEAYMLESSSGWATGRVNVAIYGTHFAEAERIGNAIIATLKDARGEWVGKAAEIWRDDVDGSDFIPATGAHRRVIGFEVRYRAL